MPNFEILKKRLALAPEPRRVALELGDLDSVETTKFLTESLPADAPLALRVDIATVTFRHNAFNIAISLYIYTNGTYSVGSSACVTTETSVEHLEAFQRALEFIRIYGLKPWVSR